jgi:hypothetical protein
MDFLLDANYNPLTANGDFVTGDNLEQQERLLLITNPGEWKQNPLIGVGIIEWINDDNISGLKAEIKRQFKADGLNTKKVEFINGEIYIDAERS